MSMLGLTIYTVSAWKYTANLNFNLLEVQGLMVFLFIKG